MPEVTLPRTELRRIDAPDGRGAYRILVALPAGPAPPQGFPVVYMLDADAAFGTMVEALRMRCRRPLSTGVVPAVVVGIGYPQGGQAGGPAGEPYDRARRTYDCTPGPSLQADDPRARTAGPATGGADGFAALIEDELKPWIERDLPVDRTRQVLYGHSLAGFFVLRTLLTRPDSFRTYLAASPSIWWDEPGIAGGATALLARLAERPRPLDVMISVGEFEQALAPWQHGLPGRDEVVRRRRDRRMADNARELASRLAPLAEHGGAVRFAEFAGEDHASVVPVAISHGLRFALAPA